MHAVGSGFRGDTFAHLPAKLRLKGCGKAELLGETSGVLIKKTMECFLTEQEGNAQPCFFYSITLQFIGDFGRTAP